MTRTSRLRRPLRALLLSAVVATTPTFARPSDNIFTRQNQCASENSKPCPATLPDGFCCGSGERCIALAAGTTVLCCPTGESCNKIAPITCNVALQNSKKYPEAAVKTIALDVELETCGDSCCPFGYTCSGGTECILDEDQTVAPGAAKDDETGSKGPTATTTTTAPTSTASGDRPSDASPVNAGGPTGKQTEEAESKSFPTVPVVVGVLCSVLGLVALVAGTMIYRARKNKKQQGKRPPPSWNTRSNTSSFGNMISEPIVDQNNTAAIRHDFILKPPSTRGSSQPTTPSHHDGFSDRYRRDSGISQQTQQVPAGPLGSPRSATEGAGVRPPRPSSGGSIPPIRGMNARYGGMSGQTSGGAAPRTPQLQREPSSESINIFAEPGTVERLRGQGRRMTNATTFTDLMEEADLGGVHKGQPFLATPPPPVPRR